MPFLLVNFELILKLHKQDAEVYYQKDGNTRNLFSEAALAHPSAFNPLDYNANEEFKVLRQSHLTPKA